MYIHDMSARRDTMNCCLFDVKTVLTGGFEMGNLWYNEPKTLDVAFDVIGDIVLSAASQQYGGFTVPSVEEILAPYAEKSYAKYIEKYRGPGPQPTRRRRRWPGRMCSGIWSRASRAGSTSLTPFPPAGEIIRLSP